MVDRRGERSLMFIVPSRITRPCSPSAPMIPAGNPCPYFFTAKLKLFLAFLLPAAPASISTVWAPEESLRGVKLKLPVVRRY